MEHLDVVVVGAGLSGIGAAHALTADCPWASFAVLESRGSVGGTWDLFRYPGVRSDSDMFTLGYSFRPWEGEKAIADGGSILEYIRAAAAEPRIEAAIRLHRRVVAADWDTAGARWRLTVERTDTGTTEELTCGFLLSCTGYYRYDHGYEPEFAGRDRFGGPVVHPQHWPADLDVSGKRVAVIGSGATAVTLVPALAGDAAHVTMVQRSPSYILSMPAVDPLADLLRRTLPPRVAGPVVRWMKALVTQTFYQVSRRWPAAVKRMLRAQVARQLPPGYDVATHFTPRYDPWDQRLCLVPDGDLFTAVREGRASVATGAIATFTETGLVLESGEEVPADVIVTATGLDLLFAGGMRLAVDGAPVDVSERLTYKGMMLEGVPNLAVVFGYTNASWTLRADLIAGAVCRLLNRMRERGVRQCTPVNRDPAVATLPMIDLSSGYVTRAADRFPRRGSRFPWQVHQSYLADWREMKLRPVDDPALTFSSPVPSDRPVAAGTGRG